MGFLNPSGAGNPSPAQRRYKWRGGEHLAEGKYRLSYYDKEKGEEVEAKLPFDIWWLEQTWSITGVGDGYYYYTNEVEPGGYESEGGVMALRKVVFDDDGNRSSEVIARGTYRQICKAIGRQDKNGKWKLPSDMGLTINYYLWNNETKQIEVLQLAKSARNAFFSFTGSNRNYDQKKGRISVNEELKKTGSVYYYEPKFEVVGEYSEEEREVMTKKAKEVVEYIKGLSGKGAQDVEEDYGIDQTPAQYQGEENQETGEKGEELDLNDVPFI